MSAIKNRVGVVGVMGLALGLSAMPSLGVVSVGAGGQGVTVGNSSLISGLDYADSFTLGVGTRVGLAPGQFPVPAGSLPVEFIGDNPARTWTGAKWSIANDANVNVGGSVYSGTSGAGSDTGMTQTGGATDYGIEYARSANYVVQFDAVQAVDRINITTGSTRDAIGAGGPTRALSVFFRSNTTAGSGHPAFPITGLPGIGLYNGAAEFIVFDTIDGNGTPGVDPLLLTGTANGTWNNYAVQFDQARKEASLYVNEVLLKTLDLEVFAGGAFKTFSAEAVTVGGSGGDRIWTDNFQVGAANAGLHETLPGIKPQYLDTFTLGQNGRFDNLFNDNSGGAYNVEQTFGNPAAAITPTSAFSFQDHTSTFVGVLSLTGNPGAAGGVAETGGGDLRIAYGLSSSFIVAADAILPAGDRFDISTSSTDGGLFAPDSLNVFFRRDSVGGAFGSIGIHSASAGETLVQLPGELNILDNDWHNYAVWFDENILRIYVDQLLRAELDLLTFAGGAYANYANDFVGIGGTFVTYMDNFVVGTAAVGVPEPTSALLLGLASVALMRRRRLA